MRTEPNWRQAAGMAAILLLIVLWAVLVVHVAEHLVGLPWPLLALYYLVAGTIWIAPLKPLLRWMETGRWSR